MSEREDNVYKAKLAEQAERYDGEWIFSGKRAHPACVLKRFQPDLIYVLVTRIAQ